MLIIAGGGSTEIAQGLLYAAPEASEGGEETTSPSGPTVVNCSLGAPPPSLGWLAMLGLASRRRRRR
jgi:MYXO-CTERM domain-containing protein